MFKFTNGNRAAAGGGTGAVPLRRSEASAVVAATRSDSPAPAEGHEGSSQRIASVALDGRTSITGG